MSHQPDTWHYGLVARYWAEFNTTGPEIDFFQAVIARHGTPALDAGCGSGRLLLPFLRAGLDVDGSDISADMLAQCRAKAEAEGLEARLNAQPLHQLDLPRQYRTIVACGVFGLGGEREQDMEGLRRLHASLLPGGVLAMDIYMPYEAIYEWPYWTSAKRKELPRDWPPPDKNPRERAADGTEFAMQTRLVDLDRLDQMVTREMRVQLWRDGKEVASESYTLRERLYFKNEVLMMLEQAGFAPVDVQAAYTGLPATADDEVLVFLARKA